MESASEAADPATGECSCQVSKLTGAAGRMEYSAWNRRNRRPGWERAARAVPGAGMSCPSDPLTALWVGDESVPLGHKRRVFFFTCKFLPRFLLRTTSFITLYDLQWYSIPNAHFIFPFPNPFLIPPSPAHNPPHNPHPASHRTRTRPSFQASYAPLPSDNTPPTLP